MSKEVRLFPICTRVLRPPKDDLIGVLSESVPTLAEGDVVVVTSKVVSIHQGRCLPSVEIGSKESLVPEEADYFIPGASSKYGISLAVVHSALIPSAGIDESNGAGYFVLLPENPSGAAREIALSLRKRDNLKELAVIITDSHCTPLRRGVTGIAIGSFGLAPSFDYRGTPDLFGRLFHYSATNILDSIASAAVGVMGEGAESTPLVVVRNWPRLTFDDAAQFSDLTVSLEEDVFAPLLAGFLKKK